MLDAKTYFLFYAVDTEETSDGGETSQIRAHDAAEREIGNEVSL